MGNKGTKIQDKEKKKQGRPNKYETHVKHKLKKIEKWASDGLSDEQIAKNIGISTTAFYRYKNDYKEFRDSLKDAREVRDFEVENALYNSAVGFEWTEQQAIKIKKEFWEDGKKHTKEEIVIIDLDKKTPPAPTSIIYWLNNRLPNKWNFIKMEELAIKTREVEREENTDRLFLNEIKKYSANMIIKEDYTLADENIKKEVKDE
jgi:hypothetical protein